MLECDRENERILKEYINNPSIFELIIQYSVQPDYLHQIKEMCKLLYAAHTNID